MADSISLMERTCTLKGSGLIFQICFQHFGILISDESSFFLIIHMEFYSWNIFLLEDIGEKVTNYVNLKGSQLDAFSL